MDAVSKDKREYYHLVNAVRGFALLHMLAFHFCYDWFVIFGNDWFWYQKPWVHVWQQFICISFLFVSGISWHFGRRNVRKGLILNLYGLLITAVTLLFLPSQVVWFGVLNGIGCATLLLCLLDRVGSRWHPAAGFLVSLLLFLLFRDVSEGFLGFAGLRLPLPEALYQPKFMTLLGFPYPGFFSSDYFPILPWSFLVMAGYWFWKLVQPHEKWLSFFKTRIPFLSTLGKHTIWIYLLHQPLLYGIAYLASRLLNGLR